MFKCPYCGVEILTEKAYWGHVEICPENPKNKVVKERKQEINEEPIEEPIEEKIVYKERSKKHKEK
jgi:hypothetical protein